MLVERIVPVAREHLVTIPHDARLTEAARLLGERRASLVVVCGDGGAMVGVASKTDVVRQIAHCQGSACTTATATVMTREVVYCRPQDPLRDVWSQMKERGFLHIPVVDGDFLPVGVINARDALHALMEEVEQEEALLRDYVMGIGYR